jgi:flagellar protein FliT
MTPESQALSHYRALADTYAGMREAAQRGDWDAVAKAELGCRSRIEALRALGKAPLGEAARRQKFALIQAMLADDAAIRDLAQPWMRRLEDLIGSSRNARRVDASYGSAP